jgi:hypothetical protein
MDYAISVVIRWRKNPRDRVVRRQRAVCEVRTLQRSKSGREWAALDTVPVVFNSGGL